MPLALDPKRKNKIVLHSDSDKPEEKQPAFIFNFLNGRQWLQLAELDDELGKIEGSVAAGEHTFKMLRKFLIGWENMTGRDGVVIPFNADRIEDIVGLMEATELTQKLLRTRPDFLKKEPSASPSASDTDVSKPAPSAQGS